VKNIFILFCVFSLFSKETLAEKVTLHFWHSLEANGLFQELAQQFSILHPDIKIITKNYPTDDLKSTIIFSILKDEAPDVALFPSDLLGYYEVLKLGNIPLNWFSETITKTLIQTTGKQKKKYGIPIYTGNHLMLFYNKSLIDKPASTWQAMAEQRILLKEKGVTPLAIRINKMYWFISFLNAYGGFPIVEEKIVINRAAMIKALKAYKFLLDEQLTEIDCDFDCTNNRFFQGEFAYSLNGLWSYRDSKMRLGENFGVALLPSFNGLPLKPMRSTTVLAFPNNSLNSEKSLALKSFAHFMQSYSVQKQFYEKVDLIPVDEVVAKEIHQQTTYNKKIVLAQLDNTIAMPASAEMSAVWPGMTKGVELFLTQSLTAEQAVDFIEKQINKELEKIKHLVTVNTHD